MLFAAPTGYSQHFVLAFRFKKFQLHIIFIYLIAPHANFTAYVRHSAKGKHGVVAIAERFFTSFMHFSMLLNACRQGAALNVELFW
jgi:hypothetical protein